MSISMKIVFVASIILGYSLWDTFDPESVRGKKVLITGASTGIGEQLAYAYARLGADVIVTARRESRLQEVVRNCEDIGPGSGNYQYITADMSKVGDYERVIKAADDKLGGIDYLILNHIIVVPLGEWRGSADNLTLIQKTMDVNFRAYVHMASHALPILERRKGSIVVVSSVAGKVPQPYVASYSASKFALDGFFGGLRQELILRDVDVSITLAVIGLIGTDNALTNLKDFGLDFLLKTVSIASPEDCAAAIAKGGASRAREIFFPYAEARFSTLLRDWIPGVLQGFVRMLYSKGF